MSGAAASLQADSKPQRATAVAPGLATATQEASWVIIAMFACVLRPPIKPKPKRKKNGKKKENPLLGKGNGMSTCRTTIH